MEQSKKQFLKNVVGFSMTSWFAFAIGFIATPIATRLFIPSELGKINMFNNYAALFGALCYLGMDQAFVRFFLEPPGKSSRASMLTFCLTTSLLFSIVSSLLLLFGWRFISEQVMGTPDFSVFACLFLFSFCTVIFRYLSLIYRMEQNPKLYTLQGVLHILLTKIAYLSVGFTSSYAKPAILLLTLLMAAFTLVFTLIQRKRFSKRFLKQVDKPFVREIAAFAAPLIPVTIISWMNASMSSVMLRNLMDFASVGIFTAAASLAATVNIIQAGFNTYWAPYVYENYHKGETARFDTVHRLMACLLTGFGLTITLLQAVVFLLLGPNYRGSVVFFPFLFLAPICYCLGETTDMGIGIKKKTYWGTIVFAVSVVLNIGLCYALIPLLGASGAAIASATAAMIALALRTVIGQHYFRAIRDYRYVIYTVGLMLAASVANYLLYGMEAIKYGVLAAIYALALLLFRNEIKTLWRTLKQLLHEGKSALKTGGRG
ncbi:MAG: lipopolysaccharide biosynthesis protein [Bacillota bacterium]